MVEFALVLPILLLVILGVFAFGHLFFVYSSVVSASREAARYGAAVGLGTNGNLRYQDCEGIRAAATRVGAFAGVSGTEPAFQVLNNTTRGFTSGTIMALRSQSHLIMITVLVGLVLLALLMWR